MPEAAIGEVWGSGVLAGAGPVWAHGPIQYQNAGVVDGEWGGVMIYTATSGWEGGHEDLYWNAGTGGAVRQGIWGIEGRVRYMACGRFQ